MKAGGEELLALKGIVDVNKVEKLMLIVASSSS